MSITDAGGGSATYRDETDAAYTGGTIPASGSCTITMQFQTRAYADLSESAGGGYSAPLAPNTFTTAEGATNASASKGFSARWGIDIIKTFDDETLRQVHAISGAATSQLKLQFRNNDADAISLNLTDLMPTTPGQMTVDSVDSNTCGGAVTTNGGTELTITGGSLPGGTPASYSSTSTCEIIATVSVLTDGTYTNEIPSGTTGGHVHDDTSAILIKTSGAATIIKTRQNENFRSGDENVYIYTISNLSDPTAGVDILNLRLRDNFEVKNTTGTTNYGTLLTVSQANVMSSTCAGTVFNAAPGDEFFDISGVTVPKGTSCQIKVQVSHKANDEDYTYGAFENIAPKTNIADATEEGVVFDTATTTNEIFGAEILLVHNQWNSFYMDMDFIPDTVNVGGVARLRYEISVDMYTNQEINNLYFRNTLPTDLTVAANPNFSSTCGGTLNAVPGSNFVEFSGGYMTGNVLTAPIGSVTYRDCWVEVDIQAPMTAGSYTSTIPGESKLTPFADLDATGEKTGEIAPYKYFYKTSSDSATLNVNPVDIGVNKAFLTPVIGGGEPSRVRITIANNTTGAPALTGVSLTDAFTGTAMYLYSNIDATFTDTTGSDSDGCRNATITGNAGDGSITLSNAVINTGAICHFEFNVTANVGGNHINSIAIGEVTSDQGISNPIAVSATLTVERELNLSKGFNPSHVGPGEISVLTIEITNSNQAPADYTGAAVALIDEMPAGVDVQSIVSNTCGGIATIGTQNGNDTIQLSGGNFNAESACRIKANVTASSTGVYINTIPIGALQTNEAATNGSQAEATLNVNEPPTLSKSFYPSTIGVGMNSRITFRVYNNTDVALTGISFTDNLSNMNLTSPMVIGGTCQSVTYNATAGGSVFEVTGGVVPANSNCTITTQVTSSVAGVHDNATTGVDSDQTGTGPVSNTTQLTVQEPPVLSKSFTPAVIQAGTVSTLTFTLSNPNDGIVYLENYPYVFQDHFPTGMTVAATPNVTMTCTGSAALRNDADTGAVFAGDVGVTFQDGTIPANGSCTASVDVTVANPGSYVNTTTAADTDYIGYFPAATATLLATSGTPPSYDYGDAPTAGTAPSGAGSNNYGEPRHEIVAGIHLGAAAPDADASYQSSLNADGDDTDGTDDDEGISSLPALMTSDTSYTIPVANISATGTGTLHVWIDLDGDGSFESTEYSSATVTAGVLSGALTWSGFANVIKAGDSFIRLRLTSDATVNASAPASAASDGEVEDYALKISAPMDFSDAPADGSNAPDGTVGTSAYGVATHTIMAGIQLGANIDADSGSLASAAATDDGADDDGVNIPPMTQGTMATIPVVVNQTNANEGYLQGWIDWDGDGNFSGTNEQISTNLQSASAGSSTINISVNVPPGATTSQTFARFRWSTASGLNSTTTVNNGEVEDYALTIQAGLPFACTSNFYEVINGQLAVLDPATGNYLPIGPDQEAYNALAYNVNDNFMYGFGKEGSILQKLLRISSDGSLQVLADMGHSSAAGGMARDNYLYYSPGANTVSRVHVGTFVQEVLNFTGGAFSALDLVVLESGGGNVVAAVQNGQIGYWDLNTNVASFKTVTGLPTGTTNNEQRYGAQWTAANGNVYASRNSSGVIYEIADPLGSPYVINTYTAAVSGQHDGAACRDAQPPSFPLERSDAPISGPAPDGTATNNYGEATHRVVTGISLGTAIDEETAVIADATASGDGADDDGVALPTLILGVSATIPVVVNQTADNEGFLQGWIDWNGNGNFTDAGEQIATDLKLATGTTGTINVSVSVPASATTNPTFARFRWSKVAALDSVTSASEGEVEDYTITISSGKEFGDAPDSYGTLESSNGARHISVSSTLFLGSGMADVEPDGQPGASADGDDTAGIDDDDGVATPTLPLLSPLDSNYRITVTATNTTVSPGRLIAWLDFDRSGTFEADEAAARVVPSGTTAGNFIVAWASIPPDIQAGATYLRLRFTTDAMNAGDAKGEKADGEVEDYFLSIGDAGATLSGQVYVDANSNATKESGEAGIGGTVVILHDVFTGTCRSVSTSGNGDYSFLGLPDGGYQLYQAHGETTPVPQSCGTTFTNNPTGYQSTTADILYATIAGADITDQDFGEVAGSNSPAAGNTGVGITFEPDHQSEVLPGNVAFYAHVFSSEADGAVRFTAPTTGNGNTATGWTHTLYRDSDCDGLLNGIEGNTPIAGMNFGVAKDSRLCIIDKVFAPANVPAQDRYEVTITAAFSFAGGTVVPTSLNVKDLTIAGQKVTPTSSAAPAAAEVGESRLVLRKTVENQTQGTAETETLNQAKPGDFLKYRIYYRNTGTGPIKDLKVNDSVPPFTGFVMSSESCDITPTGMTCTPTINIDKLDWGFTGPLIGGAAGNVSYEVMVDN